MLAAEDARVVNMRARVRVSSGPPPAPLPYHAVTLRCFLRFIQYQPIVQSWRDKQRDMAAADACHAYFLPRLIAR